MKARWFLGAMLGLGVLACGSADDSGLGGNGNGGSGGSNTGGGGTGGSATGGASGSGTGGAGGSAVGGNAGQATGGSAGAPSNPCAELEAEYAKKLGEAKVCNPTLLTQCSKKVPTELACPCETFVNHENQGAISELLGLAEQWETQNCQDGVGCPEIACPVPVSATCSTSGGKGAHCEDVGISSSG